jgi:hypothetical protein
MLDPEKALELYKVFRTDNASWLRLHREYSQKYVTLITALMVASLGALYQFGNNPWATLGIIIGPILNILLSFNAIAACDRYYRQFLEGVTVQAKLEPFIGLRQSRVSESGAYSCPFPFPQDDEILPIRWLNSRTQSAADSFVQDNVGLGINHQVRRTMRIMIFLNLMDQ